METANKVLLLYVPRICYIARVKSLCIIDAGTGSVGVKEQVRNFSLFNELFLPLLDKGGRRRAYITSLSWRSSHLPCSGLISLIQCFHFWLPNLIYLCFSCDFAAQWWQKIDCAEILNFTPFQSKIRIREGDWLETFSRNVCWRCHRCHCCSGSSHRI